MPKKSAAEGVVYPLDAHSFIAADVMGRASLKELRKSAKLTQEDLAEALCVGQDTISRVEKRSDMLLSTLRHYVESLGGTLTLVASFPGQKPVIVDPRSEKSGKKRSRELVEVDSAKRKH